MPERRPLPSFRNSRAVAITFSVVFHLIALALLAKHNSEEQLAPKSSAIQLSIVNLQPRAEPQRTQERQARSIVRPHLAAPSLSPPVLAPVAPHGDLPQPLPTPPAPEGNPLPARARQALRAVASCDRPGLTRDEREKCNAQRWAQAESTSLRLDLDPAGHYAEDKAPVLSRRPTNGCRARVTGAEGAMGNSAGVAGGATCVVPF